MKLKLSFSLLILVLGMRLVYAETVEEKFNKSKAAEYSQRGASYFSKGNYWMAIEEFKKSLELSPDYYMSYTNLGYAYLYTKKPDEALGYFNKALSLKPECLEAIRGIGTTYLNLKQYDEAAKYLEKSIKIDPDSIPPYMALGETYNSQRRYKDAIPLFEKVIAKNPDFVRAYVQISFSYSVIGEYEKGYQYIKKAQQLSPNDPTINDLSRRFEEKLKNEQANRETVWKNSIFQEPKSKTGELVEFTPVKITLPLTLKYPANWYIREEVADVPMLCISREPIKDINDKYKVGFSAIFRPDYFVSHEPENTKLGKMAKAVVKIVDWKKDKERFVKNLKENGNTILAQTEIAVSSQPGLRIEYNSSVARITLLYIKLGKDALMLIFEAPPNEYDNYKDMFEQMIKSVAIRSDFRIISVSDEAARITQEQINAR